MALDELVATIETIKQRIKDHRSSLAANETRTRQVLIDPLLKALGWDVTDPARVALEYSAGQGRADYALLGEEDPVAVIEAKRLNDDMDNHVMQALNYANSQGIKYMITTNGDEWRMYDVFRQAQLDERVVMRLRIESDAAHVSAIHSLQMWNVNLNAGRGMSNAEISEDDTLMIAQPTSPVRNRVHQADGSRQRESVMRSVTSRIHSNVESTRPRFDDGQPNQTDGNWHRIDQLGDLYGRRGPIAVKDASGSLNRHHRATWADFYRKTVSWLIDSGVLTSASCPIRRPYSNRRIIADTVPFHGDGSPLKANRFEYQNMFFDLDYTANRLVENALILFRLCDVNAESVFVRFD